MDVQSLNFVNTANSGDMDDQIAYLINMMSLSDPRPKRDLGSERHFSRHDAVMSDSSDSEDSTYAPSQPVSLNPANSRPSQPVPSALTSTYPPSPYPPIPSTDSISTLPLHPSPPTLTSDHDHTHTHIAQPTLSQIPTPAPPATPHVPTGCSYLQYIASQLQSGQYSTTSGDYLETIFTHREALFAYPSAHKMCSIAFSDLAALLEARSQQDGRGLAEQWTPDWESKTAHSHWRPDWEGDAEAVAAFRHEAVMIGSWTGA